jgi:hypothetical protein
MFQMPADLEIAPTEAWIALLCYCAVCLWLLLRKVRAYEVIR